jgi:hypothetical protein
MIKQGLYDFGTDFPSGDIFLETFQYFLGLSLHERPSVVSISYGTLEEYMTLSQASSMCTAAQQLAAAGMTIVVRFDVVAATHLDIHIRPIHLGFSGLVW